VRTPLAWRNFAGARRRSAVIVAGVNMAILLIFMQLGFRASAETSATSVQDALAFDIILISADYVFVGQPASFPRERLEAVRGVAGVTSVAPLWIDMGEWRNVETRERWHALTLGIDPAMPPFRDGALDRSAASLFEPDTGLSDRRARPEIGRMTPGTASEVEDHRMRIIGDYSIGAGFTAGTTLVTGRDTFFQIFPTRATPEMINLGLVELAPGVSADQAAAEMNRRLAPAVRAVTRAEIVAAERSFWLTVKPIGVMFNSGVAVAFIAGAVILYQVLTSEVQLRIREYATLKALGYADHEVAGFVLQQGLLYALLGFAPALVIATVLYALLKALAQLPIEMTAARALEVLVLTLSMGLIAGLLAVRKLSRADPADLF
jgi:putative ABC transport system permease protein